LCTQANDLHSFAVSADASAVFYISDKTQLIKWLVGDSDVAAETDLSASLPALADKGKSTDRQTFSRFNMLENSVSTLSFCII